MRVLQQPGRRTATVQVTVQNDANSLSFPPGSRKASVRGGLSGRRGPLPFAQTSHLRSRRLPVENRLTAAVSHVRLGGSLSPFAQGPHREALMPRLVWVGSMLVVLLASLERGRGDTPPLPRDTLPQRMAL